jgi:hypothetical protein
VKYWLDCEFIEDGKTVDLVSIGIVAEDGRELYLQSVEFDPSKASEWVQDNVLPNLSTCPHANVTTDSRRPYVQDLHYHRNRGQCTFSEPDKRIIGAHTDCSWRTRNQLVHEVFVFMDVKKYGKPEIWTYYGCYDHVAFCQLFGTMMDLPDGYPMYTRDIMQWCEALGSPSLPEQSNVDHNALYDARWNKRAWDFLKMLEGGEGYLVGEEKPEFASLSDGIINSSVIPSHIKSLTTIDYYLLRDMVQRLFAEELLKLPAQIRQQMGRVQ